MIVSGDSVVLMAASFDLRKGLLIELLGVAFLEPDDDVEDIELAAVETHDTPESLMLLFDGDDSNLRMS